MKLNKINILHSSVICTSVYFPIIYSMTQIRFIGSKTVTLMLWLEDLKLKILG